MQNVKFSQFTNGGNVTTGDIIVGLRAGVNTQFTFPDSDQGLSWTLLVGITYTAQVNNGYIIGNAEQTIVTLPSIAAVGDQVAIEGVGAGGWILAANTGQTIRIIGSVTSTGGSVISTNQWDSIIVRCIVANTLWKAWSVMSAGLTIT